MYTYMYIYIYVYIYIHTCVYSKHSQLYSQLAANRNYMGYLTFYDGVWNHKTLQTCLWFFGRTDLEAQGLVGSIYAYTDWQSVEMCDTHSGKLC